MAEPKKYIKVDGVMKKNPEYEKWKAAQSTPSPSAPVAPYVPQLADALPVVSNMDDVMKLNEDLGQDVPLAESANATIDMMQEPDISHEAGMEPDEMVDELGAVFSKYEVPLGMMNKLMMLSEFHRLEFMIDDSGSMNLSSSVVNPVTKEPQTRWKEAQFRLKEMVEILAYVPFHQIDILFLNRKKVGILKREHRTPKKFLEEALAKIDALFSGRPSGMTPALQAFQDSMRKGKGTSVARYFFCDGMPDGGQFAKEELIKLLKNRESPECNPVTFLSCSDVESEVEWMKDAEEVIPYCSESDDYLDEAKEILKDQGAGLPYTLGFHLLCQLVAAMNPDDLDAMDESVPLTKRTLDNLLGLQHNDASYRYYFSKFLEAQRNRPALTEADRLKKEVVWSIDEFLHKPVANQITQVQQFQRKLAALDQ